jgi:hypothetical protein
MSQVRALKKLQPELQFDPRIVALEMGDEMEEQQLVRTSGNEPASTSTIQ